MSNILKSVNRRCQFQLSKQTTLSHCTNRTHNPYHEIVNGIHETLKEKRPLHIFMKINRFFFYFLFVFPFSFHHFLYLCPICFLMLSHAVEITTQDQCDCYCCDLKNVVRYLQVLLQWWKLILHIHCLPLVYMLL